VVQIYAFLMWILQPVVYSSCPKSLLQNTVKYWNAKIPSTSWHQVAVQVVVALYSRDSSYVDSVVRCCVAPVAIAAAGRVVAWTI